MSIHADPRRLSCPVMTGGDRAYRENKHGDVRRRYILPSLIMAAKKIEIETAMFAAKIDRNRSILQKSQSTQH